MNQLPQINFDCGYFELQFNQNSPNIFGMETSGYSQGQLFFINDY